MSGHVHPHAPLEAIEHVQGGAPVLDIGGDVGALVVLMDEDAAGTELHLRPDGSPGTVHTGVWTRHQGPAHITAALFCALTAGGYRVLDVAGDDVLAVTVTGGELTTADLRSVSAGSSSPRR